MDEKHSLVFEIRVDGRRLERIKWGGPTLGILLYQAGKMADIIFDETKAISKIVYDMKARYDAAGEEGGHSCDNS